MAPALQYFLVRPETKQQTQSGERTLSAAMVPLVPVDQLPDWIDIDGVPRQLEAKEASRMANVGRGVKRDRKFDIRLHTETVLRMLTASESGSAINDNAKVKNARGGINEEASDKQDAPLAIPNKIEPRAQGQATPVTQTRKASNEQAPTIHRYSYTLSQPSQGSVEPMLKASRHAAPNPPSSPIDRSEQLPPHISSTLQEGSQMMKLQPKNKDIKSQHTSYCRHWCHHGTCKWGLDCRYEHTMPATLEGLQEVGLKSFPSWFLTAMGWTLSGMRMGPVSFGMDTMGMSSVMSRMGMFGHGGGGNAKKAKKFRGMMAMVPLSAAHESLDMGSTAAGTGQEAIQRLEVMQVDGVKPNVALFGSNGGKESEKVGVRFPESQTLPILLPACKSVTSDRETEVAIGEGGIVVTKPEEKLVDI